MARFGARGKSLRRGRCHSVNELWQGRVGHGGDRALAEVVVIEAEDSGVGAKPQFVRAMAPGQVVVDEEPRGAPSLDPGVVEPSDGREWRVRADALQNNRKCRTASSESRWARTGFRTRRKPGLK